jgi:hypothetical protein
MREYDRIEQDISSQEVAPGEPKLGRYRIRRKRGGTKCDEQQKYREFATKPDASRTSYRQRQRPMIPVIYDLAEAARLLGFSESYLRSKLRDRTFAGMKRAGRWAMTEAQIEAAIESMCIDARPADPPSPSGLSKHSRYGRHLRSRGA